MAFIRNLFGGNKGVEDRLEEINDIDNYDAWIEAQEQVDAEQRANSTLDEARNLLEPLNDALANRKFGVTMRGKLERANVKLTVAEYAASHVVASVGAFALLFILRGDIISATIGGLVGFFIPRFYVNREVNQRLYKFESQLPDTLMLWVNALRSGFSVMQAMEAIAKDSPEPTMTEFRRIVKEVQLGIDMEDALDHLLNRIQSEDLDLVVTAVNIQREVGGNLAEILEVISHTIRERIKLKGEIRVLTSQGRYTGYLISFLPIGLAFFLNFASPGYMGQMLESRRCGWPLMGVGLALIGMGTAAIQKIVDIEI
jgi:tight adherence protein B